LAGGMPSLGIYRRYALRTYGEKCELCGYNKYKEALEVHHIDKNRRNNNIKNLMVLCPNCHRLLTLKIGIIVKRKFIVIKTKRSQPCFEGYGN
jgi:predicted restriction endonuclease